MIIQDLFENHATQDVAEAIVGKPRYSAPHQSGRGFYSAAEYMVRTNHQLGSHAYTAVTQVDGDNDRYYFIYQKGNKEPVFYATDMGQMDSLQPHFEIRTDKLGSRVSNAIMTAHRKATDHDLEKYMSGDDDSEWDQEQGVAEGGIIKSIKRGLQGWDKNAVGPGGEKLGNPKDIVKRAKAMDTDTAKKVRSGLDAASDHSPAGLQKRVLDRKLKGVAEGLSKPSVCKHCGKKQGEHRRGECPKGTKTAVGYTDYGPTKFEPREPNKRGVAEGRPNVGRHTGDKTVRVVRRGGKPIGEIGIDAEASPGQGQYYVKLYDGSVDMSGYDTAQEALEELRSALDLNEDTPVATGMGGTAGQDTAPAQSQAQSAALATAQQQQQKREMQDQIKDKQAEISQLQKAMVTV